jgi:hypothetical protein
MLKKLNKTANNADIHPQPSFSDIELCAHWRICPRTSLNRRKAGKMPPHFLRGQQIRYLVSDIEAYEKLNA